jgi:hypothetical protein
MSVAMRKEGWRENAGLLGYQTGRAAEPHPGDEPCPKVVQGCTTLKAQEACSRRAVNLSRTEPIATGHIIELSRNEAVQRVARQLALRVALALLAGVAGRRR